MLAERRRLSSSASVDNGPLWKRARPNEARTARWDSLFVGTSNTVALENQVPSPRSEALFAWKAYHSTHDLQLCLDSQGFQLYADEHCGDCGLRVCTYVNNWFPLRGSSAYFQYERITSSEVTLGFIVRGTDQQLLTNVKADAELVVSKLKSSPNLPSIMSQAIQYVSEKAQLFMQQHRQLHALKKRLRIAVTGHSLGGAIAEVVTVELDELAHANGWNWSCTSFESPGLPDAVYQRALREASPAYWKLRMTSYLSFPNPINMFFKHLGRIVHVTPPLDTTVMHVVGCVTADALRLSQLYMLFSAALAATGTAASASGAAAVSSSTTLDVIAKAATNVGAILGVEAREFFLLHSIECILNCFDVETGELKKDEYVEMKSWPHLDSLRATAGHVVLWTLKRTLLPSFVCKENSGLYNMLDRRGMILRRCRSLPGYVTTSTT